MVFDIDKTIMTLSTIFTIVILSATGVQNVINDKFRKLLVNNLFLKHVILIASIYSTGTYKILKISDKKGNENNLFINLSKSVVIWGFLLLLFKIDFTIIVTIIGLVICCKAIKELDIEENIKNKIIKGLSYIILIIYSYGLIQYFSKNKLRNKKSLINSILKTL